MFRRLWPGVLVMASVGVDACDKAGSLESCLATSDVQTLFPSDPAWSNSTRAWNARIAPVPAVIVFPTNEQNLVAALKCASEHKVKVTTLGGNRSFSSLGFGRINGSMVINLRNMYVLAYDEQTQLLRYGGPVTISDAARYLWGNFSRTFAHGRCADVGMSGLALGGGFGTLSRATGTALDNIAAARVALANGTIIYTSLTTNANVFWGIRGAGTSLGVVVSFDMRVIVPPSTNVHNYTITFPADYNPSIAENAAALLGVQSWALSDDSDDYLSVRFFLKTKSYMYGFFYGTDEQFQKVIKSLLGHLPAQMSVEASKQDFWPSENLTTPGIFSGPASPRRYFYITSVTIPRAKPLDVATATALFNATAYAPQPRDATASGFTDLWAGSFGKTVASDATAWRHDDNLLLVRWDMRTDENKSFSSASLASVRQNFYNGFVNTYKSAGGIPGGFPNYRDSEWSVDEMKDYLYGDKNWNRLLMLKKQLDPTGLFNSDIQTVPVV